MNHILSRKKLLIKILFRFLIIIPFVFSIPFISAGTIAYLEAWVYLGILICSMVMVFFYLLVKSPELLERRMEFQEKEKKQKVITIVYTLIFLFTYILSGLDKRYGWSKVSIIIVALTDITVTLGYIVVFLTFRENRFASRIIKVEKTQKVINTGLYSLIRHPMYLGSILIYVLAPIALGSYWALIPASMLFPLLILRIRDEEKKLTEDLEGYKEYIKKVKYRLIPGIW